MSDVQERFDEAGHPKPIHDLPEHVSAALQSVDVVRGTPATGDVDHRFRFWDTLRALDLLLRHLQPASEPERQTQELVVRIGEVPAGHSQRRLDGGSPKTALGVTERATARLSAGHCTVTRTARAP